MKDVIKHPSREDAISFIVRNGYPFYGTKRVTTSKIVGAEMKKDSFSLIEKGGYDWPIEYYTKIYVE